MPDGQPLAIFGTGGLGREMLFLIESLPVVPPLLFLDDAHPPGGECHGIPVRTLEGHAASTPGGLVAVALGAGARRCALFDRVEGAGLRVASLFDPSSRIGRSVQVSEGVIVAANCTITTDIHLGRGVFVNGHSTIGHDSVLDDFATLFGNVNVGGGAHIGWGATLGTGSVVLPGVRIGPRAVIGAGAVVTKHVPAGATAVGVPATARLPLAEQPRDDQTQVARIIDRGPDAARARDFEDAVL